jgi:hypothetical protein
VTRSQLLVIRLFQHTSVRSIIGLITSNQIQVEIRGIKMEIRLSYMYPGGDTVKALPHRKLN